MSHFTTKTATLAAFAITNNSEKTHRSSNLDKTPSLFDGIDDNVEKDMDEVIESFEYAIENVLKDVWQVVAFDIDGVDHFEYVEAYTEEEAIRLAKINFSRNHVISNNFFAYILH